MDFRGLFHLANKAVKDVLRCEEYIAEMDSGVSSPRGIRYDAIRTRSGSIHDPTDAVDAMMQRERRLREACIARSNAVINAAYAAAGIVSADISDATAQALTDHYLYDLTWDAVAKRIGRGSKTTPKDMASAALDWLDSYCEVYEDDEGPHVRMRRG